MGLKSSTPCLDGVETSGSHGGISSISVHEEESLILQEEWLHDVCGVPQARVYLRSGPEDGSHTEKSLTVKNGDDNKSQSKEATLDNLNEKDEPPSPEEVKSWSESFDKLMNGSAGRKVFREFLRSEYSEENMLFWLACEDLKSEQNPELVEEKARLIYEDYISILSPKEVSLDSRVREVINRNMVDPTSHTFDEAQLQIYTLMHRDSYPRFLNSQIYKRLLQRQQLQQSPPPQQHQPQQQLHHHQQQQ